MKLNRILAVSSLVLGAALCFTPFARAADAKKPNILVIWGDDIGVSNLSCYSDGLMGYRTPNIDRLGREGVYFRNAFCTTSLCSPSRASILSGLYAHAHGVTNNFTEYPSDMASFPGALQAGKRSRGATAVVAEDCHRSAVQNQLLARGPGTGVPGYRLPPLRG